MSNNLPIPNANAIDPFQTALNTPFPETFQHQAGSSLTGELINANVEAGTTYVSNNLEGPLALVLYMYNGGNVSGTTLTVEVSMDGLDWFQATNPANGSYLIVTLKDGVQATDPAAGGSVAIVCVAANYYKVKTSNTTYLIIRHTAFY